MTENAEIGRSESRLADLGTPDGTQVYVLADDSTDSNAPAVVLLRMPPGYRLFRHAHL